MAIQDIIEKIKKEGEAEIRKINEYYASRIQEIKNKQAEETKKFYEAELDKIAKEAEEIKRGMILSAKLERRKQILKAKRAYIEQVFEKVKKDFKNLVGKEKYYQFLKSKIEKFADNGDTVYLSDSDIKDFSASLSKDISKKIEIKSTKIDSGLIIEKKNFNYNFSISSLLEQKSEALEKKVGKALHVL